MLNRSCDRIGLFDGKGQSGTQICLGFGHDGVILISKRVKKDISQLHIIIAE